MVSPDALLSTAGPSLSASELMLELGHWTDAKHAVRITLNKAALKSRVIAVRFDGATYSYVRTGTHVGDLARWEGRDVNGSPLWVSWSSSGARGQIVIGRRMLFIAGQADDPLLVEVPWGEA